MSKQNILSWFQQNDRRFTDMTQKIWDNPQIAYEESYAASLQYKELLKKGFTITSSIADIPRAFMAEFGSGRPIIGILGEYDALPGLSQKVSATKEEVIPGGPGHGCGHNLLGTAGVESVIALKEVMKKKNIKG